MVVYGVCPKCGEENTKNSSNCLKCGAKFNKIELTERERIINTINVSMLNGQLRMVPNEKKEAFLYSLLKTKGITASPDYLVEIVNSLNLDNVKAVMDNIGILGMYGKLIKPMGSF